MAGDSQPRKGMSCLPSRQSAVAQRVACGRSLGRFADIRKNNAATICIPHLPRNENMVDVPEKLLVAYGFSHNGIEAGAQRALDGVKGVPVGVVVRVLR